MHTIQELKKMCDQLDQKSARTKLYFRIWMGMVATFIIITLLK